MAGFFPGSNNLIPQIYGDPKAQESFQEYYQPQPYIEGDKVSQIDRWVTAATGWAKTIYDTYDELRYAPKPISGPLDESSIPARQDKHYDTNIGWWEGIKSKFQTAGAGMGTTGNLGVVLAVAGGVILLVMVTRK